jgi:hypothetical protein
MTKLIGLYSSTPGCGKSEVAAILRRRFGFYVVPFAQPIKTIVTLFLVELGVHPQTADDFVHSNKNANIPEVGTSARHLCRTLGTEWGRSCVHPEVWLKCWEHSLNNYPEDSCVVVDDVRFMNEAKIIQQKYGGLLWKVERPFVNTDASHASDGNLDTYSNFDTVINNNSTLGELANQVDSLMLNHSTKWARPVIA